MIFHKISQFSGKLYLMAYHKYRLSYGKQLYYILCIVALAVILLFSFLGPRGYRDLKSARLELQAQRARIDSLQRRNREHIKSIEALRNDKHALEEYARKKGYGRVGEIVQQLPEESEKKPK
jgi:cell division protein FtsB